MLSAQPRFGLEEYPFLPVYELRGRQRVNLRHPMAIFQGDFPGALQRLGAEALHALPQRLLRQLQFAGAEVRQFMAHLQQEFVG